jgi:hypothetical protein
MGVAANPAGQSSGASATGRLGGTNMVAEAYDNWIDCIQDFSGGYYATSSQATNAALSRCESHFETFRAELRQIPGMSPEAADAEADRVHSEVRATLRQSIYRSS